MHSENYLIPSETFEAIEQQKDGRKIFTVGTTTLRALESFSQYSKKNKIDPKLLCNQWLETNLFIYPDEKKTRYQTKWADALITNFHQPKSTLFMLICSLIGYDKAHKVYQEAIKKNYRFFSYGDCSLLWL